MEHSQGLFDDEFVHLTVRHVIDLEEIRVGDPIVASGETGLDNVVRWVHVSELPDIGHLLRGGELILTTGIALPSSSDEIDSYVDSLASVGVSGIIIELGRRFDEIPDRLIERAGSHGIALVGLRREVRFVHITERVHGLILGKQLEALRASEKVHRAFMELTTAGATVQQVVNQIAELSNAPVFLENLAHQVLVYSPHLPAVEALLERWERQSRLLNSTSQTEVIPARDGVGSWVATEVSARGEHWGRLLMHVIGDPTPIQIVTIERGATALALNQLADRDRETLERQSHRTLLGDIWSGSYASPASVALQAHHLGVPFTGRMLIGVIATMVADSAEPPLSNEARDRDYAGLIASVAHEHSTPALVGVLRAGSIGVVLSLPADADQAVALESFARSVHRAMRRLRPAPATRIGAGSAVDSVRDLRRSLVEAEQVVSASAGMADDRMYFAMPDIRIHGLLYLLRNDPRVQLFVERELSGLLAYDEANGTDLLRVLRVYLACAGNKSLTASELGMSRPALYQRLRQVEEIIGTNLEGGISQASLHVAVLARDVARDALVRPTER